MATYSELAQLFSVGTLRNEISVAVADSAQSILTEPDTTPNHTERFAWAAKATSNPGAEASRFLIGVLVANKAATIAQIQGASDTAIQTNVDALVDLFAIADSAA